VLYNSNAFPLILQVGLRPPPNTARPPCSYPRRCRLGCVRRRWQACAARGSWPGTDPPWRAARAAFLAPKSLPKQAPKPADYRANVAFKSHSLVQKGRPRSQRRRPELLRGAGAVRLSCDVRIRPGLRPAPCSPATRSGPGEGAFE